MKTPKTLAALTLAAAVVTGGYLIADVPAAPAAVQAEPEAAAQIGQPAPDFELMDQDGNPVSLGDYAGEIVVLEWFNDQCPFVKKWYQSGKMNELAAEYETKGVKWLAVDSSSFTSVEENKDIAGKWEIDRPLLDDAAGEVGRDYGAKTTPHMYVVDAEGNLAYMGAIDSIPSTDPADIEGATNYVRAALDELLAGESVSQPQTKPYGCSVKY